MKYGFIGAGNMASAIIKGMTIGTNSFNGKDIYVYNIHRSSAESLSEKCGTNVCDSAQELINCCDVIILAVKPNVLPEVIKEVKEKLLEKSPLLISIAAGKTIEFLQGITDPQIPIVRVMPNINAKVGCSTSAFCTSDSVTEEQKDIVKSLFSTIGSITELPEKLFSIHGVIGGSAPAFAYLYIDALARAAVKAGMSKPMALEMTAQTVLGSAKMVLESGEHPWALIDQVCSPGGTTIEGICSLEANGFEAAIHQAFDSVYEKDKKL
ncbi:pyrroline-5-carboxylate reductase [Clostridiales bacterium]|nr:pyrroline-5-carboxylate reductase [Clostridiales bacterium]